MEKLKLNTKNTLMNHPELYEDLSAIRAAFKNSKCLKKIAYDVIDSILSWTCLTGAATLLMLLFLGFIFNPDTYVSILLVGLTLLIAPIIIAVDCGHKRDEEKKKRKNNSRG